VVTREHNRAEVLHARARSAEHLEPTWFAGKRVDLDREEIWPLLLDQRAGFGAGSRLPDHLHADPIQDELDRVQPDRMWIEQDRLKVMRG
jgi:hypothetical protein